MTLLLNKYNVYNNTVTKYIQCSTMTLLQNTYTVQ